MRLFGISPFHYINNIKNHTGYSHTHDQGSLPPSFNNILTQHPQTFALKPAKKYLFVVFSAFKHQIHLFFIAFYSLKSK